MRNSQILLCHRWYSMGRLSTATRHYLVIVHRKVSLRQIFKCIFRSIQAVLKMGNEEYCRCSLWSKKQCSRWKTHAISKESPHPRNMLSDTTNAVNIGTGVQLKYLVIAGARLFAERLEGERIMSVCRQQWTMVEVPHKYEVTFLQMEF